MKAIKYIVLFYTTALISIVIAVVAVNNYGLSQDSGYRTVFVIYEGFLMRLLWAMLLIGIGLAALIGSVAWIRSLKLPRWWSRKEAGKPSFLLLWSILFFGCSVVGFSVNLWEAYQYVDAYRSGRAGIIEGEVHVLHEQPASGHSDPDIIEIGGVRLTVNAFGRVPVYKETIASGGALREGVHARVYYYSEKILRVDIQTNQPNNMPASTSRNTSPPPHTPTTYNLVELEQMKEKQVAPPAIVAKVVSLNKKELDDDKRQHLWTEESELLAVVPINLDDDGITDYLVYPAFYLPAFHGAHSIACWIFRGGLNSTYALMLEGRHDAVIVLPDKTNGLRGIDLIYWAGQKEVCRYKYDGQIYQRIIKAPTTGEDK
ncbi:MAG: hypothetical protein HZA50_15610 [Planctomycetes bacterium]|nr:hypothetical protein [Planctomycetota bacterium]